MSYIIIVMGKALYRTYRSTSLDEIVGQSHITSLLKRAIASGNIAHAYLLTGPRGVGKTSIARILAHEINQLPYEETTHHIDIVELDAASNNSVDDIRDLREKARIAPVHASKKIYIIDEVHMLSKQAFNALLKTLEEPPEHVVFILATTDADKLPATIISRVQRLNFRAIAPSDAVKHLRTIAEAEHIAIDDEALELVAHHGRGSFRDSISLLDQLRSVSDSTITARDIEQLLGVASMSDISALITAYKRGDLPAITSLVNSLEAVSIPSSTIAEQLIRTVSLQLHTAPHLAPMLNHLTEVTRSPWPYVKLLVALTPPDSQSVPLQPSTTPAPVSPSPKKQSVPDTASSSKDIEPTPSTTPEVDKQTASHFSWQALLDELKQKEAGLHTLLARSDYTLDGPQLTIYSGRAFNKKRVDRSLPTIASALESLGFHLTDIKVEPTNKPPEDSVTAGILDMMGGGEVVDPNA